MREYDTKGTLRISKKTAEEQITGELDELKKFILNPSFRSLIDQRIAAMDIEELFDEKKCTSIILNNLSAWSSKEYFPFFGLAQHHKTKTQLLDRSSRSYVAAYFATRPLLDNNVQNKTIDSISVWVYRPFDSPTISTKQAPLSGDKNMTAQSGCFTIVKQNMTYGKNFVISALDDIIPDTALWRITLPKSNFPEILKYCYLNRIDASTIYPDRGLDSISEANSDKEKWGNLLRITKKTSLFTDPSTPV